MTVLDHTVDIWIFSALGVLLSSSSLFECLCSAYFGHSHSVVDSVKGSRLPSTWRAFTYIWFLCPSAFQPLHTSIHILHATDFNHFCLINKNLLLFGKDKDKLFEMHYLVFKWSSQWSWPRRSKLWGCHTRSSLQSLFSVKRTIMIAVIIMFTLYCNHFIVAVVSVALWLVASGTHFLGEMFLYEHHKSSATKVCWQPSVWYQLFWICWV